jgi:molecular chaperone HscB
MALTMWRNHRRNIQLLKKSPWRIIANQGIITSLSSTKLIIDGDEITNRPLLNVPRNTNNSRIFADQKYFSTTTTTASSPINHQQNGKVTTCWSCQKQVPCCSYFCPYCQKVLKPADHADKGLSECGKCSYFELLQVPPSFSIDTKSLEQNFKKLQMNLHPDKFSTRSKEEQELSAIHSQRLNEAFTTLKSPVRRALYMLEQKGVSGVEEGKTETDLEILTEAMSYREKLENAKTADELAELKVKIKEVIHDVEKELAAAIGDTAQINHSVRTAVRMRYLEKVLEEIDEKNRKLIG